MSRPALSPAVPRDRLVWFTSQYGQLYWHIGTSCAMYYPLARRQPYGTVGSPFYFRALCLASASGAIVHDETTRQSPWVPIFRSSGDVVMQHRPNCPDCLTLIAKRTPYNWSWQLKPPRWLPLRVRQSCDRQHMKWAS